MTDHNLRILFGQNLKIRDFLKIYYFIKSVRNKDSSALRGVLGLDDIPLAFILLKVLCISANFLIYTEMRRGSSFGRIKDLGIKLKFLTPYWICIFEIFLCMESFLVIS